MRELSLFFCSYASLQTRVLPAYSQEVHRFVTEERRKVRYANCQESLRCRELPRCKSSSVHLGELPPSRLLPMHRKRGIRVWETGLICSRRDAPFAKRNARIWSAMTLFSSLCVIRRICELFWIILSSCPRTQCILLCCWWIGHHSQQETVLLPDGCGSHSLQWWVGNAQVHPSHECDQPLSH